ncbi:bifunctional NAD(P)HX epimerase / NAD(P)HX dehydratase [Synechococcus sp. BIOS-E4-1]|nr:bifunctional NAD(P)HX epimerase / NAD(P)HX dehydratase [Synechococcus sp. BIOS-E4-1]
MIWPPVDADHLLVSADQMLALERQWLASGLPVAALMETVGQRMADWFLARPELLASGALVLVGPGHNGGDGLVVGRKLLEANVDVRVWAPLALRQPLTQEHWRHLQWLGAASLQSSPDPAEQGLWIEALFGLGQKRPLPADLADLLQRRQQLCPGRLVSLDLPAGLDSDTGCPINGGAAIAADTLCVGLFKRGLVQDAALAHVGRLHRIDPDVPVRLTQSLPPPLKLLLGRDDLAGLPRPPALPVAMKYQRGRLLLIAGSERYRGAAHLVLRGALASGAGSVEACLPDCVADHLWQQVPEVVLRARLSSDQHGSLEWGVAWEQCDLARLDAVLLGPGLGMVQGCWRQWADPLLDFTGLLVLDADGLNQLAAADGGWRWLLKRSGPTWITPHGSEFDRLFPDCLQDSPPDKAAAAADCSGAVVLLKGAHSVIASPGGDVRQLTGTDPEVARTGLGDLLAGHAAGWGSRCLAAKGDLSFEDLAASALLHAVAARQCDQSSGAMAISDQLASLTRFTLRS